MKCPFCKLETGLIEPMSVDEIEKIIAKETQFCMKLQGEHRKVNLYTAQDIRHIAEALVGKVGKQFEPATVVDLKNKYRNEARSLICELITELICKDIPKEQADKRQYLTNIEIKYNKKIADNIVNSDGKNEIVGKVGR